MQVNELSMNYNIMITKIQQQLNTWNYETLSTFSASPLAASI